MKLKPLSAFLFWVLFVCFHCLLFSSFHLTPVCAEALAQQKKAAKKASTRRPLRSGSSSPKNKKKQKTPIPPKKQKRKPLLTFTGVTIGKRGPVNTFRSSRPISVISKERLQEKQSRMDGRSREEPFSRGGTFPRLLRCPAGLSGSSPSIAAVDRSWESRGCRLGDSVERGHSAISLSRQRY